MTPKTAVPRTASLVHPHALAAVIAVACSFQPIARADDGTIARLADVRGNVLVSRDFGIASAGEALRLLPDTRVLTTANAAVVVQYDDGCRVHLEANQRFVVESQAPCAVRSAHADAGLTRVADRR